MIGARIRQARLRAGLSLDALRDALGDLGCSITKASLSKYERDESRVPATMLFKLAQVLDVAPEDFLTLKPEVPIAFDRFRKKSRFGLRRQEQLKASVHDEVQRYLELIDLMGEDLGEPWAAFSIAPAINAQDAERAAEHLRKEWELGSAPIESVCQLLEDRGFIVLDHREAGDDFDGLSGVVGDPPGLPLVIYAPSKPLDRRRFSLTHELGHLAMRHPEGTSDADRERLAHRFAGSFLVPASAARKELGTRRHSLDLRELELLKQKYGMSMLAWVRRAHDLEIITPSHYKLWCRYFSVRGWRREEPVAYANPLEQPTRRLLLTLRALSERRVSPRQAERICPGILNESRNTSMRNLLAEAQGKPARRVEALGELSADEYLDQPDFLEADLEESEWFVDPAV